MTIISDNETASGRAGMSAGGDRRMTAIARLAIGFVQGLGLWWLFRTSGGSGGTETWPATRPEVFGPLLIVIGYLPVVLLAGVGRLRLVTLIAWGVIAGAVLAFLAWHDIDRRLSSMTDPFISFSLMAFGAAALFIAHHLVVPADRERLLIATFPAYFDAAWMAGVQLALSLGFAGAFWLLLFLGAALFNIIGLSFLGDLIARPWFAFPLTGLAFATAVQLTDVRDGLIRGVRTVALMLLSWLLLVLTVLVAGFLAALPFTGLDGLWDTGSATALVLAAAGALIVLINTAYQDGRPDNLPPVVLRIAVRVASVLLTPLIVIAFWGLGLRIGQHGLTPDRIIAVACAVVGAAYAAGYGYAALIPFLRKGDWMQPLERTNLVTAVLTVAVILALFSPLADPARLSIMDQMARLARGAVTPDKFDYAFLRFESGRVGEAALVRLARSPNVEIARRAREAQAAESSYNLRQEDQEPAVSPLIQSWPAGSELPPGFVVPAKADDPRANCRKIDDCVATTLDMNGDARSEILLANTYQVALFAAGSDGVWARQGDYPLVRCPGEPAADARVLLKEGRLAPAKPQWPDLATGGRFASDLSHSGPCGSNPVRPSVNR